MEYNHLYYTLLFTINTCEELSMNLKEFITEFAETHSVQHIDEIQNGIITANITGEIYLVQEMEVTE